MTALDVFLHDERVGRLERLAQARLRFSYSDAWIGVRGMALSLSLPVRAEPFDDPECRPFFAGLLPEGDFLQAVARAFGVSAANPFAVLEAIGGECAGAVSLSGAGAPPPPSNPPRWLGDSELVDLIEQLPSRPLLAGGDEDGLRLSLAGAQDKLPVVFGGGRIGITRGEPPSTHILKLPDGRFEDMAANEAFCLALASEAGLNAVKAGARVASRGAIEPRPDDREYLLVWRYDRAEAEAGTRRIHQEDLCQALSFVSEAKYEADGGPGVADCANLLRRHSAVPAVDLLALLDSLLFNFLIGNHDAHSKNLSLVLEGERAPRLAPLYDLVSTAAYEGLSRKMAMRLGGEYRPEYVRGRHLARLATDLGMAPAAVRDRAESLCERVIGAHDAARAAIPAEFEESPILDRISAVIEKRAKLLRDACAELRRSSGATRPAQPDS